MNAFDAALPPYEEKRLIARLHLDAVLPAMALLAPHDAPLRTAVGGRRDLPISFEVKDVGNSALTLGRDGTVAAHPAGHRPGGALRLWFSSPQQFLQSTANQAALPLPLGGWSRLGEVSRLREAGRRVESLLRDRSIDPVLFGFGNLAVGLAATTVWLREHPAGAAQRPALHDGVVTFSCPDLPADLWIDCRELTSGRGDPPRAPLAEVTLRDLDTLVAELDQRLDSLAALGGGEIRIRGHLLVVDRLNLILAAVSRLLNPPATPAAS